jgi:hypothetical protein
MIDEDFSKPADKYILKEYSAVASAEELTQAINTFCHTENAEVVSMSLTGMPKVLYRIIGNEFTK